MHEDAAACKANVLAEKKVACFPISLARSAGAATFAEGRHAELTCDELMADWTTTS